jgi:hypothetical protein
MLQISAKLSEASRTQDFSIVCVPCYKTFVTRFVEISRAFGDSGNPLLGQLASIAPLIKSMCTKDEFGQPCGRRLAAAQAVASSDETVCPDRPGPGIACPTLCAQEVARFKAALGCCFVTLFGALGGKDGPSSTGMRVLDTVVVSNTSRDDYFDPRVVIGWIENTCRVRIGGPCSGVVLKTKFILRNLRYAFYTANKQMIDAKLRSDLAFNYKCLSDSISVDAAAEAPATSAAGFVTEALVGVTFDLSFTPEDNAQSKAITDQINAKTAVVLPSLSTLPPDSRADPGQPMAADLSQSTVQLTYMPPDSASSLAVSGFVVAITALLTLLLA